jgi:hypothetical protein
MLSRLERDCTGFNGRNVVLRARIVDSAGRPMWPWNVAAIEFRVIAYGACGSANHFDSGEPGAKLFANDVVLPRLVTDESWSVVVAGYNFRHEFVLSDYIPAALSSQRLELRYIFTGRDRTKTIVRFHLKAA